MKIKLVFIIALSVTLSTMAATFYPQNHTSNQPQKIVSDGYGWTTYTPTGETWMCAVTTSGYCVPVAGGGGTSHPD